MSYKNSIRLPAVEATPCGAQDRFTFGALEPRLWDAKLSLAVDERNMWRVKVLLRGAKVYFLLVEGELFDDDRIRKCCLEK